MIFLNRTDYAYSVAYVRAIESRLMTNSDIESLIGAKTAEDAFRILSDKGYGQGITLGNWETVLSNSYKDTFNEIKDIAPKDTPLDVLIYKNDFHNLKVALKGVQLGLRDYGDYVATPSVCEFELLKKAVVNADFDILPPSLKEIGKKAYDLLGKTGDSQLSDTIIDKSSMDYDFKKAVEGKNEFLIGLTKLKNTLTDIKIASRCALTGKDADFLDMAISSNPNLNRDELIKAAVSGIDAFCEFLSGSGYEAAAASLKSSLSDYEKYADEVIGDYMKGSGYITMGIEPLISYIYSKEREIQSVRIIISAKLNGIDEGKIRQRLRKLG